MKKYFLASTMLCLVAAAVSIGIATYAARNPESVVGRILFTSTRLTFGARPAPQTESRIVDVARQDVLARKMEAKDNAPLVLGNRDEQLDPKLVKVISQELGLEESLKLFSDGEESEISETDQQNETRQSRPSGKPVDREEKRMKRIELLLMPNADENSTANAFRLTSNGRKAEGVADEPETVYMPYADE